MTFGNNDCKYHDSAPFKSEKQEFYTYVHDLWFNQHPANQPFASLVKSTFMDGGYYRIPITDSFSLLAVNSLEYNLGQYPDEIGAEAGHQFDWLSSNLSKDNHKYVIFEHIYAGGRGKHSNALKYEDLWTASYDDNYFDLLEKNRDRLMLEIAGHDHWEDLRVFEDANGELYRNLLVLTGVGMDHN